jgi:hypothetical protein
MLERVVGSLRHRKRKGIVEAPDITTNGMNLRRAKLRQSTYDTAKISKKQIFDTRRTK